MTTDTKPGFVPTLLDYAYLIEWLNDKPDDAPMPERFKPLLDDALERARLGYLARIMREHACYECGRPVDPDNGEQHGRAGWVHTDCIMNYEDET